MLGLAIHWMSRSRLGTAINTSPPSSGTNVTSVRMMGLRFITLMHPQPNHVHQNYGRTCRQPGGIGADIARLHAPQRAARIGGGIRAVVDYGVDEALINALPQPIPRHGDERHDKGPIVDFVDVIFVVDGAVESACP